MQGEIPAFAGMTREEGLNVDRLCLHCGYEGRPKKILKGSRRMEIILWTVFLVPGPPYSLYRFLSKKLKCPNCGKPGMVKKTSSKGKAYLLEMETELLTHQNQRAKKLAEEQKTFFSAKAENPQDSASQTPQHTVDTSTKPDF